MSKLFCTTCGGAAKLQISTPMPGGLPRPLKSCSNGLVRAFTIVKPHSTHCFAPKGEQLGPIGKDGHQSFRIRKDGTKSLPLPPVLDPVVLSERSRWEQPKARPDVKKFAPFQRKLWENPYGLPSLTAANITNAELTGRLAHALASPVRQCRCTQVYLPSFLMISLHPKPHPETSQPWLLPVSLTTSPKLSTPYRFLGRKLVAEELHRKASWRNSIHHRFENKYGNIEKMVWREDMPQLIISLLQRSLLNKLRWHFKQSGQLIACDSPHSSDIKGIDDVSCILFFGTLKTRADAIQTRAAKIRNAVELLANEYADGHKKLLDPHLRTPEPRHKPPSWWKGPMVPHLQPRLWFPPLEFNTTKWRGRDIAVYSLYDLLGEENLRQLIQDTRFEVARCVAMKRGRHNVPVELLLMQSQAFVAKPGL
ncbi:hypothetical protein CC78DRAFT_536691 [Lojkania enalia]|uniref:Uncharacterized protein n=1 Tax=Lojkania enalia TaxID=147567 RepID=A0A9P4K5N7_9PLEO|nr:hypothetical protein CC78DRAFT_536691 [Didymosphaeria enalia]